MGTESSTAGQPGQGRIIGYRREVTWSRRRGGGWWWATLVGVPAVFALVTTLTAGAAPGPGAGTTLPAATASWTSGGGLLTDPPTPADASPPTGSTAPTSASASPGATDCDQLADRLKILTSASRIAFGDGSARLPGSATDVVDSAAKLIRGCPEVHITVLGYTGSDRTSAANDALSKKRADAVAKRLRELGVTNDLTIVGRGGRDPIASNANAAGRAKNRRVELRVEQ